MPEPSDSARWRFGAIIGASPNMQAVYRLICTVCQHQYPVLILGESGTGKELVARSIHFNGVRSNKPFVPVDCSALVPTLIESELFGHVRGAFTGASHSKRGLFEAADGGTLFLDEIAEMPVSLQSKLLRVLQEREVRAVGATQLKPVNVRIMAATNRDLKILMPARLFREDLYFRLNVVQIKLPPLRERRGDIPLLTTAFLEKCSNERKGALTISGEAMDRLVAYDWPGNVRELENCVQRAVAFGSGPVLQVDDLPPHVAFPAEYSLPSPEGTLRLVELERRAVLRALKETAGDRAKAARLLGIGKTTLYRKLALYRIPAKRETIEDCDD